MDFFNFNPRTDFHELNLDMVVEEVKKLDSAVEYLLEKVREPEQKWQELQNEIDELNQTVQDILDGKHDEIFTPRILEAIDEALPEMISRIMQFFIFGLTKDGYFTAMYPDTFEDVSFDTIADPESDLYGHLVLQF